jgi:hypothetical protein
MEHLVKKTDVREIPLVISDNGKVRTGGFSPAFPSPVRATPTSIGDKGNVRMGAFSPAFPKLRSK